MLTSRLDPLPDTGASALGTESEREAAEDDPSKLRLAELLHAHFQLVWRAVRRFGVPPRSADDAAQEVFIVAAAKLDDIRRGKERQFLYSVAARVAANFRRGAIHLHESPGEQPVLDEAAELPDAEALLDQKRQRELLDRVLDGLTEDLRTAFVLFELEGLSVPEIAEVLEVPVGTVASRLRRARELFTAAIQRAQRRLK